MSTETEAVNKVDTLDSGFQTCSYAPYCVKNFVNDPAGIHFYTGLESYEKFSFVLYTLGPSANNLKYMYAQSYKLSVEDQFFLTLIKLRRHSQSFELSKGLIRTTKSQ